jgi:hypothetical protein
MYINDDIYISGSVNRYPKLEVESQVLPNIELAAIMQSLLRVKCEERKLTIQIATGWKYGAGVDWVGVGWTGGLGVKEIESGLQGSRIRDKNRKLVNSKHVLEGGYSRRASMRTYIATFSVLEIGAPKRGSQNAPDILSTLSCRTHHEFLIKYTSAMIIDKK